MRGRTSWVLLGLLALYFGAHAVVRAPALVEPYVSFGGMVNWTGEVRAGDVGFDASLDEAARESYFRREGLHWSSKGHTALLRVFRAVGDPVTLSKIYPWALLPLSLLLLFGLAAREEGAAAGFLAGVLFLHMPALYLTLSGIPVSWAFPLLLLFLWAHERGTWLAIAAICLGGLFYPSVALIGSLLFLLRRVRPGGGEGGWRLPLRDRSLWALAGAMALTMMIASPPWKHQWNAVFGSGWAPDLISYEEMLVRNNALLTSNLLPPLDVETGPRFQPYQAVIDTWARDIGGALVAPLVASGLPLLPLPLSMEWAFRVGSAVLLLGLLAVCAALGARACAPPRLVRELLCVGLGLYLLAVLAFPWMFFPQRYVAFTLPLATALWTASLLARGIGRLPERRRLPATAGAGALVLLVAGSGIPFTYQDAEDYRPARGVLEYLAATPPDTRVAGPVYLMDGVELFADRETFVYCQEAIMTGHMLDGAFYEVVYERLEQLYSAYYAPRARDVALFMDTHDVDLMVVDESYFSPDFEPEYESPCAFVGPKGDGPPSSRFALAGDLGEAVVYDGDGYRVIALDALLRAVGDRPPDEPPRPDAPYPAADPADDSNAR